MMKLVLYLLLIVVFIACSNNKNNPVSPQEPIAFTKDISPEDSFWYTIKINYDTLLKLPSIENGVDSFEFRFWTDNQLRYGDNAFIIKYENGKWVYENHFFLDNLDDPNAKKTFSQILKMDIPGNSLSTKHSFEQSNNFLLEVIKKYNLDTFPTQSSLKNYDCGCKDGVVYFYELTTKNSYKFCVYENPDCCKEKDKMNIVFLDFLHSFNSSLPNEEWCWPMCAEKNNK